MKNPGDLKVAEKKNTPGNLKMAVEGKLCQHMRKW